MNKRGGGVVKVNDFNAPTMQLFKGGLKNVRTKEERLMYGNKSPFDYHDQLDYERVILQLTLIFSLWIVIYS